MQNDPKALDMPWTTFCALVRKELLKPGMSVRTLAFIAGVDKNAVYRASKGLNISVANYLALAEVLHDAALPTPPATDAGLVERLQVAYDRVAEWPEKRMPGVDITTLGEGFIDLLHLRNLVPEAAALITALTGANAVRERDEWKANHDEMVQRNAVLRQRPDLPVDRLPAIERYETALQAAQAEVARLRELGGDVVRAHDADSGAEPSISVLARAVDNLRAALTDGTKP